MKDIDENGSPTKEPSKMVSFFAASSEEEPVEVVAPEPEPPVFVPVPKDPLSEKQAEAALLQRMIAEARASAKKKDNPGGSYEKKAVETEKREKELQKKIASLYTTTMWAGRLNYECKACPYATLDEDLIKQHVTKHI